MEAEDYEDGIEAEGESERDTPRGAPVELTHVGENVPPPK